MYKLWTIMIPQQQNVKSQLDQITHKMLLNLK